MSGIYSLQKETAYIPALKKELLNIPAKTSLTTLFIGGGTPTALSVKSLTDLIAFIFERFHFAKNYEATIEANPGTIDSDQLESIRLSGINRISIGVQSFDDAELKYLGRLHSSREAQRAVSLARHAGFRNLGIDLIYGIPGQSIHSWKQTLEKAVKLKPEHISTYELTIEQGTLLYENIKAGKVKRADEEKIIEMYNHTVDYLSVQGFEHYEISNFAVPDYFCRHNLNYWDRGEYYGAGQGAHSFINSRRFANTDNLDTYISRCLGTDKLSPVNEAEDITQEQALFEAIFLGLRKTRGVNIKDLNELFGKDILSLYKEELRELQEAKLIEPDQTGKYIRLTRKGLLLSNEVYKRFT